MEENRATHIAVNLAGSQVGGGLGKASVVAVAEVVDSEITSWQEYPVGWDVLHGQGPHGTHHGRIVRFLREHNVDVVVTGHVGPSMLNTLAKLGIAVHVDVTGDARQAAVTHSGANHE